MEKGGTLSFDDESKKFLRKILGQQLKEKQ